MARFDVSNYVDVQQRITRFWSEYPEGRIHTELMSLPDEFERVVFRASIYKGWDVEHPAATGWAAEVAGGQGANQTSWHENCETSAIGRALANMGYATSGADRPSRQEMQKAARGTAPPAETTRTTAAVPQRATGQGNAPQQPKAPTSARPLAGPGPSSEAQHRMLRGLAKQTNPDPSTMSDDRWLHGQMYARFRIAHLADLSKLHASGLIDWFQKGDFVDCQWAPEERGDPVEAMQAGLAQMPEEPAHLRAAPWD